jgi:hypothetical protein
LRRNRLVGLVAVVAILAAVLGLVVGSRIRSPAELAAQAEAPSPSLLTVPIEERVLSSRVLVRGTITSSEEAPVTISAAGLSAPIVTRAPLQVGDSVEEGDVLVEISTRPIIAFPGAVPVFRSLTLGVEGPDVEQLEAALVRLDYMRAADSVFDTETSGAIEALYRDLGYQPQGPTPEDDAELAAADAELDAANRSLTQARLAAIPTPVPESALIQLEIALTEAEKSLEDALEDRTAELGPLDAAVAERQAALTTAEEALALATTRLSTAEGGTHPDTSTVPTPDELQTFRNELAVAETRQAEAGNELAAAEAQRQPVQEEYEELIARADAQVRLARASLQEVQDPFIDPSVAGSIAAAESQVEKAGVRLHDVRSARSVVFPAAELAFIPTMPARVRSLDVALGSTPEGPVLTLSGGETILRSALTRSDWDLLSEGLPVSISDEVLGVELGGTIEFLASQPGGTFVEPDRYLMEIRPEGPIADDAFNESVRVEIPITSTDGVVLAVPVAAVSAQADRTPRIEIAEPDGTTRLVEVRTGLAADGFVEIEPANSDTGFNVGDVVVVGRDLSLPGGEQDN